MGRWGEEGRIPHTHEYLQNRALSHSHTHVPYVRPDLIAQRMLQARRSLDATVRALLEGFDADDVWEAIALRYLLDNQVSRCRALLVPGPSDGAEPY